MIIEIGVVLSTAVFAYFMFGNPFKRKKRTGKHSSKKAKKVLYTSHLNHTSPAPSPKTEPEPEAPKPKTEQEQIDELRAQLEELNARVNTLQELHTDLANIVFTMNETFIKQHASDTFKPVITFDDDGELYEGEDLDELQNGHPPVHYSDGAVKAADGYVLQFNTVDADSIVSDVEVDPNDPLFGKIIYFTGEFPVSRAEAILMAKRRGMNARNDYSLPKKTNYLVVGKPHKDWPYSSKLRKAKEWNAKGADIKIMDWKDFNYLICM